VVGEEAPQGLAPLGRVAGGTGRHYVAAGLVAPLHSGLDVVHRQLLGRVLGAAVDASVAVPREDLDALHRSGLTVDLPDRSRRYLLERLTRFLDSDEAAAAEHDAPPRLTLSALEALRMSRSRDRILTNLEEMNREAFDRAKESGDPAQMVTLDFAYRREQLYFEILLDIRDALERR
jgi:hypothetical protein